MTTLVITKTTEIMETNVFEITKKNSSDFKTIIPLTRSQVHAKITKNTKPKPFKPLDKVSQLSLLQNLGRNAIDLSFSSISDISIECVELHDNTSQRAMKALLLSVTDDSRKRNFYLIDLNSLLSSDSKTSSEELSESKQNFEDLYHNLSLREQKVLHEVSKGNTSNEIACKFFISTNTVKNHRKNIKKKLNFADNQDYSKFLKWSLEYCVNR